MTKMSPAAPFPERLGRSSLGPSAPACILRYESSLGKTREGAPSGSIVAVVLSLQTLGIGMVCPYGVGHVRGFQS